MANYEVFQMNHLTPMMIQYAHDQKSYQELFLIDFISDKIYDAKGQETTHELAQKISEIIKAKKTPAILPQNDKINALNIKKAEAKSQTKVLQDGRR